MSLEGQRLGEFEIIERIGQGGMGAVYKAVQTSLQRTVAIKTLQPALAADPEYIARFHREAIAAAGLSHQNLVQVYAAGETDGIHWFAMEFVKGESAQVRLKRKGYIDVGEAIAIGVHLANALDYAWSRARLIHRDIKPDNIFLSGDGDVKLGDLGLAKMAEQTQALTVTGASMGTPYYVSPEQAEGRKDIDLRADIYSLGCTLYHLVSGQTPFSGDNAVTVMMKHVTSPAPDILGVFPACPPVLAEVILKMMQKEPAARQQSYEEVNADLRRAFDELNATAVPVVSPRAVAAQRPVAVAKKGGVPAAAWAGGAFALLAAIAALVYFAPWKKGDSEPGGTRAFTSTGAGATPITATKDTPFVNSLGMKFVPVPILGGATGGQRVLFSVWDTRVQDYEAFVKETKREWPKADFEQGPTHPAVMVRWEDAQLFCQWLTARDQAAGLLPAGFSYRLPNDHEWSCAVELGGEDAETSPVEKDGKINDVFPWGKQWPPPKGAGNFAGEEVRPAIAAGKFTYSKDVIAGYNDGFVNTSPVGSFAANRFGLFDIGGNVQQWCEDWFDKDQKDRVLRGSSWILGDRYNLLASHRHHGASTLRGNRFGFRCVAASAPSALTTAGAKSDLSNPPATASSTANAVTAATKDAPFVNSLGMKFVPVPIVSGPTAGQKVLFGVWDVRVQDYAVYAANAGGKKVDDAWTKQARDGVPAGRELNHPVVGVSWEDAQGFCQWLTEKETTEGKLPKGLKYRLPTDEEWSWAVGLPPELDGTPAEKSGKNSVDLPWGKDWPPTKKVGNYADETFHAKFPKDANDKTKDQPWIEGYTDGYATTSPVGSFPANAYGLYDMGGNVWQWCEDWFDAPHKDRVMRGASWSLNDRGALLSSCRFHHAPGNRGNYLGIRCVVGVSAR